MRLATTEEADAIKYEARAWLATTEMWTDSPSIARSAVAEFIANSRDLTLYSIHLKEWLSEKESQ